jgi:hypothetical protein
MTSDDHQIETAQIHAKALAIERLAQARELNAAAIRQEAQAWRELEQVKYSIRKKPVARASGLQSVGAAAGGSR